MNRSRGEAGKPGSERRKRTEGGGRVRHLFACWPRVARSIRAAEHLALFLDFDGTLVPLRPRSGDVKPLDQPMRKLLRRLATNRQLSLFVISGRPLAELRRLVPLTDVRRLGLHGWEGRRVEGLAEEKRLLRRAKRMLESRLINTPQVRMEDKGLGVAVHYRGAPPAAVRRARVMVGEILAAVGPRIHLLRGHKVWELLPRQINGKGGAARALLSELPAATLPIFVGDDTTDESAFAVLRRGLTVHVGNNHRTKARFRLQDPAEVKKFLAKLEAEIP